MVCVLRVYQDVEDVFSAPFLSWEATVGNLMGSQMQPLSLTAARVGDKCSQNAGSAMFSANYR